MIIKLGEIKMESEEAKQLNNKIDELQRFIKNELSQIKATINTAINVSGIVICGSCKGKGRKMVNSVYLNEPCPICKGVGQIKL